ncbi:MAG: ribonuclease III [Planctomycetota bacterium]
MIDQAQDVLGYRFNQPDLLAEALTHASSADGRLNSNERLEFLGDAILGYVICEHLYHTYPELLEGELTKIKSTVVSRKTCAKLSKAMKLHDMLSLGKGMTGRQALPASVAADVFESVIAAIYLDGGIDPARDFILHHMGPVIEEARVSTHQQNFKSVLQQFAQKHLPKHPEYAVVDEKGPDHSKSFQVAVQLDDHRFPPAWAASKKQAEQAAALHALSEMGLVTRDDDDKPHLIPEDQHAAVADKLLA